MTFKLIDGIINNHSEVLLAIIKWNAGESCMTRMPADELRELHQTIMNQFRELDADIDSPASAQVNASGKTISGRKVRQL